MQRTADFSPCRTWRYTLKRVWDENKPPVLFILLNPSTADELHDDPTNRRGIGYAKKWGCGAVTFCNLFAYRTPYPKELKKASNPIGPENDEWILQETFRTKVKGGKVILAWGTHGDWMKWDQHVIGLLREDGLPIWCMGLTKHGHPKHILYLKGDLEPIIFGEKLGF